MPKRRDAQTSTKGQNNLIGGKSELSGQGIINEVVSFVINYINLSPYSP